MLVPKTKGHPHAEIMAEYAEVAKTNPEPWCEFEHSRDNVTWFTMQECSSFENKYYRRKPRTININGYEVPEPMRVAPVRGTAYWAVQLDSESGVTSYSWLNDRTDNTHLKNGTAHFDESSAEVHAKALRSFTCRGDEE